VKRVYTSGIIPGCYCQACIKWYANEEGLKARCHHEGPTENEHTEPDYGCVHGSFRVVAA